MPDYEGDLEEGDLVDWKFREEDWWWKLEMQGECGWEGCIEKEISDFERVCYKGIMDMGLLVQRLDPIRGHFSPSSDLTRQPANQPEGPSFSTGEVNTTEERRSSTMESQFLLPLQLVAQLERTASSTAQRTREGAGEDNASRGN
jgi:hypothetical protein